MRRYKLVACILLILSIFSFVLAAPVAVQELRKACADAVDGSENVKIGSGKRADVQDSEEDPMKEWLAQAQHEPSSSSSSQDQGSSSAPNYASGTHPNPSFSPEGEAKSTLRTSTETQPASPSEAKSVSWAPSKEVLLPSGETVSEPLTPESGSESSWGYFDLPTPLGREEYLAKMAAQQSPSPEVASTLRTSTETQPASPSEAKSVSWTPSKEVLLPSGETVSEPLTPEIKPLPLPPGREGYLAKMAAQQFASPDIKLASPSSYFEPPPLPEDINAKVFDIFDKIKFGTKFRRTSGTVSGTVDAAKRVAGYG
ncbi:hypothetical protein F5888DRAFT_1743057 [Russula emetica]|nr:hypothetical protein F5888DRAFT_1743057 [Russula emetica]